MLIPELLPTLGPLKRQFDMPPRLPTPDREGSTLAWVVTAYVLAFGGLLLLGGRLADRHGHRRVFLIGTWTKEVSDNLRHACSTV